MRSNFKTEAEVNLGATLTVQDVVTPKVLPPPPRRAQNSSVFCVSLAVTKRPSGVTTSMLRTWTLSALAQVAC